MSVRWEQWPARSILAWGTAAVLAIAVIRPAGGGLSPHESRLLERLSGAEMWRTVRELCDAPFEGRRAGTMGASRAVETLAGRFQRTGLDELKAAPRYRQPFSMKYSLLPSRWDRKATLSDAQGAVKIRVGYPEFPPKACQVTGPAVLLGYGIHRPDRGWDDYARAELDGKVAVFWQDSPPGITQALEARCQVARERGAIACLVLTRPEASGAEAEDRGLGRLLSDFPVVQLRPQTAARLFAGTTPVARLSARLRSSRRWIAAGRTLPAPTGARPNADPWTGRSHLARGGVIAPEEKRSPVTKKGAVARAESRALARVSLSIPASVDPARPIANVIGARQGNDPLLRDEWVILSAHLDHLGMAGRNTYFGADDDASGVAVVCAVAEQMVRLGARPKRSVLFALWNGEECGLLGSRHYVGRPVVPLSQTVGVLQLDMVGAGQPRAFLTSARRTPAPVFRFFEEAAHSLQLQLPADSVTGISDHIPFVRAGVPGLVVTTAGAHPNYHSVNDRAEFVQPAALENCARLMALTVWRLANAPAAGANAETATRSRRGGGSPRLSFRM